MSVTLTQTQLQTLLERNHRLEQTARDLTVRLDDTHTLLRSALHELAIAKGKAPEGFYTRWLGEHTDGALKPRRGGGWR